MRPGVIRAHSPCWLINRHRKRSTWRLRNNQRDCLQSWRLDWSVHSPRWLGIRHRKLIRYRLENRHRNCFPSWHLVLSARIVLLDSVIVTENRVADDSDIINETSFIADVCIGQRTQSQLTRKSTPKTDLLPTRKSSPKLLPQLTLGFVFTHSPS